MKNKANISDGGRGIGLIVIILGILLCVLGTVLLGFLSANKSVMPNVVGTAQDEALLILEDLNLEIHVEFELNDGESGMVLRQEPREGKRLYAGDIISLFVSAREIREDNKILIIPPKQTKEPSATPTPTSTPGYIPDYGGGGGGTAPAVSEKPAEPEAPSESAKPADPTESEIPSESAKPADPTESEIPSESAKPADPTTPPDDNVNNDPNSGNNNESNNNGTEGGGTEGGGTEGGGTEGGGTESGGTEGGGTESGSDVNEPPAG